MENKETLKAVAAEEQQKFYFDTTVRGKVWLDSNTYRKLDLHLLVKAETREKAQEVAKGEVLGWWGKQKDLEGKLDELTINSLKTSIVAVIQ